MKSHIKKEKSKLLQGDLFTFTKRATGYNKEVKRVVRRRVDDDEDEIPEPHPLQPTPDCHLCVNFNYKLGKCDENMEEVLQKEFCPAFVNMYKKKRRRKK